MKINWILRLKNKTTLAALASAVILFAGQVAAALGATLPVDYDQAMAGVGAVLTILVALGVIVDPTTQGVGDSAQAMTYDAPKGGE